METLMRRWQWATVLAVVLLSGCGYNTFQQRRRAGQGRLVRGAEPVPAPRRPDAEPRGDGEGLRRAGEGRAHRRHRGARARSARSRRRPELDQRPRGFAAVPGRRRASSPARCRGCWWSRRTIRSSSRTPTSATCRRSSRARRTASRSRATATSRRCEQYNVTVRSFPTNLTAMAVRLQAEAATSRSRTRSEIAKPPKVDFGRIRSERWRYRVRVNCASWFCCWSQSSAWAEVAVPPLDGARHRPDRYADAEPDAPRSSRRCAAFEARKGSQIAVLIVPTHRARDDRAIRAARRRAVEARPQGRRRRRAPGRGEGRPHAAHRGRLRPRGALITDATAKPHHRAKSSRRASARATSSAASAPASTG